MSCSGGRHGGNPFEILDSVIAMAATLRRLSSSTSMPPLYQSSRARDYAIEETVPAEETSGQAFLEAKTRHNQRINGVSLSFFFVLENTTQMSVADSPEESSYAKRVRGERASEQDATLTSLRKTQASLQRAKARALRALTLLGAKMKGAKMKLPEQPHTQQSLADEYFLQFRNRGHAAMDAGYVADFEETLIPFLPNTHSLPEHRHAAARKQTDISTASAYAPAVPASIATSATLGAAPGPSSKPAVLLPVGAANTGKRVRSDVEEAETATSSKTKKVKAASDRVKTAGQENPNRPKKTKALEAAKVAVREQNEDVEMEDVAALTTKGKGREPGTHNGNGRAETETDAGREAINASRRAANRQAAIDDPSVAQRQRVESGKQRSQVVGEAWACEFEAIAHREQQKQAALQSLSSDLTKVQAVVDAAMSASHHRPILATSPIWDRIPARTQALLLAVANNPNGWDPEPFLKSGAIVISKRGDPPPVNACTHYLRRFKLGADAAKAFYQYVQEYPADCPNAVAQLLFCGEEVDEIRRRLHATLEPMGLEDAGDKLLDVVEPTVRTFKSSNTTKSTVRVYTGIAHETAPGDRMFDDLEGKNEARVVNFLEANPGVQWDTFQICDWDTKVGDALEVRTIPGISEKERAIRALIGDAAMNSAPGGVQPCFIPPPDLLALQARIAELVPRDPFPLGSDRNPQLEKRVRDVLDDEAQLFGSLQEMAPETLQATKSNAADVLRVVKGRVLTMHLAKDITKEGLEGRPPSYWDAAVGPAPQEDRWMRRLFDPAIPAGGNLTKSVLALHVGCFLDFWRMIIHHWFYYLHVLLLSRLFGIIRPLIITSQSNPVAAALGSGDLVSVWGFLSEPERTGFLAGHSPATLLTSLPKRRYRELRADEFNERLGSIVLVRTGLAAGQISLHIPIIHYGSLAHDPILAPFRWKVSFIARIVSNTVIQIALKNIKDGPEVDWDDDAVVLSWLKEVKATSERYLGEAGVIAALEKAKKESRMMELSKTFVRTAGVAKRSHERWVKQGNKPYKQRNGVFAAPRGEQREAQVDRYIQQAEELDSFGLPCDPDHLGCYEHPVLGASFPGWVMSLRDGRNITFCANARGRTKEGYEAVQKRHKEFGQKAREREYSVDVEALVRKDLVAAVEKSLGHDQYDCQELHDVPRIATCPDCTKFVVGAHAKSKHRCSATSSPLIQQKTFPDLERVLYPHDILNDVDMLAALGDKEDVLAELGLVAFPAQEVLDELRDLLQQAVPAVDFAALCAAPLTVGDVYVREEEMNDNELLLTLAVDLLLSQHSTCPAFFATFNSNSRTAWKTIVSNALSSWFRGPNRNSYLVACKGSGSPTSLSHLIISDKVVTRNDTRSSPIPDNIAFKIAEQNLHRAALRENPIAATPASASQSPHLVPPPPRGRVASSVGDESSKSQALSMNLLVIYRAILVNLRRRINSKESHEYMRRPDWALAAAGREAREVKQYITFNERNVLAFPSRLPTPTAGARLNTRAICPFTAFSATLTTPSRQTTTAGAPRHQTGPQPLRAVTSAFRLRAPCLPRPTCDTDADVQQPRHRARRGGEGQGQSGAELFEAGHWFRSPLYAWPTVFQLMRVHRIILVFPRIRNIRAGSRRQEESLNVTIGGQTGEEKSKLIVIGRNLSRHWEKSRYRPEMLGSGVLVQEGNSPGKKEKMVRSGAQIPVSSQRLGARPGYCRQERSDGQKQRDAASEARASPARHGNAEAAASSTLVQLSSQLFKLLEFKITPFQSKVHYSGGYSSNANIKTMLIQGLCLGKEDGPEISFGPGTVPAFNSPAGCTPQVWKPPTRAHPRLGLGATSAVLPVFPQEGFSTWDDPMAVWHKFVLYLTLPVLPEILPVGGGHHLAKGAMVFTEGLNTPAGGKSFRGSTSYPTALNQRKWLLFNSYDALPTWPRGQWCSPKV
ncbi:hypothetical protein C8R46DRAFT_1036803 [Mycena filopes]|nr:hypothetical protein C8R46DRAFT_1036803 [Mycena filopes]